MATGTLIGREIFHAYADAKKKYSDFDTWIAEAIRDEYGEDMVAPLMSAKIAKTSKLPWDNPVVFEKIALTLNGRMVLPDIDQDISVKEIAFAVKCLKQEFPDDDFDTKVLQYFAAEAGEEGIAILPPELKEAQSLIPPIFLNKEQQAIQNAYLDEIKDYVEVMTSASQGGDK